MKKTVIIIAFLASATMVNAQRYITKTGHILFHSEAPLETIEAHNRQVNSALDAKTGMFVFKVLMKSFVFEKALMQEHFNENYVESDRFPNATFKGKIVNNTEIDYSKPQKKEVEVEGTLTIHGVSKPVKEKGTFEIKKDGTIHAHSSFTIKIKDFNITIPSIVTGKIAEEVTVTVDETLKPLK